jgi:hypothetical protein
MSSPPNPFISKASPPPKEEDSGTLTTTSNESDWNKLQSSVFDGQAVSVMLESLVVPTLLSFTSTSKHIHSFRNYEMNRRKKVVSINKANIAGLLQVARMDRLFKMYKGFPPSCPDLYQRAFALQQQSLATIDYGIDPCGFHPIHGHVCNCHQDPLFRAERQQLMHHENCPYDNIDDMPMLPLIFYTPSFDHRVIANHMYLRCSISTMHDDFVHGEVDILLNDMYFHSFNAIHISSSGSLSDSIEFRNCAQQLADYCFKMGYTEELRDLFLHSIHYDRHEPDTPEFLRIYQYVLTEMDKILLDFSSHARKLHKVLDDITVIKCDGDPCGMETVIYSHV